MARMTKITTRMTPIAASGLWRAMRGSEMVEVDKVNFSTLRTLRAQRY